MTDTNRKRKLIEVALPLDEINAACKADKDRKTGTIRNLHKWFAPMPLPAWRALLFAALVDDPEDDNKRVYLLDLMKRLVGNGAGLPDREVLDEARDVLAKQFPDGVPTVMDPFCGGGSTLVEAQRLGLPSYGSDLNPVPVLITRTLTEILPRVVGRQPLHEPPGNPLSQCTEGLFDQAGQTFSAYEGLKSDVVYHAAVVGKEADAILKPYFPRQQGEKPIAWLWARTATCPNPACGISTILSTSWWLSKRKADLAWVKPEVRGGEVALSVVTGQRDGTAPDSPKIGDGVFACISCGATLDGPYLRREGKAGRLGLRLIALVTQKDKKRTFRAATPEDSAAIESLPEVAPFAEVPINTSGQGIRVGLYGMDTWDKVFAPRQLFTLTTFADLGRVS